jgi:hypothetical protein
VLEAAGNFFDDASAAGTSQLKASPEAAFLAAHACRTLGARAKRACGGARRERALILQVGDVTAAQKTGQREHLL